MNFRLGLLIITFLIWIFAFIRISNADAEYDTCIARCKADVMQVHECIADERQYWENGQHIPEKLLAQDCSDKIRNERQMCYAECGKEESEKANRGIKITF